MVLPEVTFSGTSPAAAGAATLAAFSVARYKSIFVACNLVGATGGTLDIYFQIQGMGAGSTAWFDYVHLPQLASGAAAIKRAFSCSRIGSTAITTIGQDTSPVLAANTAFSGDFGASMRIYLVAGASTSAGAALSFNVIGSAF